MGIVQIRCPVVGCTGMIRAQTDEIDGVLLLGNRDYPVPRKVLFDLVGQHRCPKCCNSATFEVEVSLIVTADKTATSASSRLVRESN